MNLLLIFIFKKKTTRKIKFFCKANRVKKYVANFFVSRKRF